MSGRAVAFPIYKGTFERNEGHFESWPETTRAYIDWTIQVVNDARRSLDYLETRSDIDLDRLGYYGNSWGSRLGSIVLALEPRLKAAVFRSGGMANATIPPQVDTFNFAPRVTVPVLMLNGNQDFIFPLETAQKPMFGSLGTPDGAKRHVIYDGGHGIGHRNQEINEILDWLDRYLGPVQ